MLNVLCKYACIHPLRMVHISSSSVSVMMQILGFIRQKKLDYWRALGSIGVT